LTTLDEILIDLLDESEVILGDILRSSRGMFQAKESGIYIMYAEDDVVLYVGQTQYFKNRLYSHFGKHDLGTKMYVDFVQYVKVIRVETGLLDQYEMAYIRMLQPCFNGVSSGRMDAVYGYHSLFKEKKSAKTSIEISELIHRWGERKNPYVRSVEMKNDDNINIINAIREAIKLVVIHADDKIKDDIIDGLLSSIKNG
jgi:hypothetical protein